MPSAAYDGPNSTSSSVPAVPMCRRSPRGNLACHASEPQWYPRPGASTARATEAPGDGHHWGSEAWHSSLPRGERIAIGTAGTLAEILFGPSNTADGTLNLIGALRRAMAMTGYTELKEFQRVEIVVQ